MVRTCLRGMVDSFLPVLFEYFDKFIFLKGGSVFAAGGPDVITPETIQAVYDVPVEIKNFQGAPVVIPMA